MGFVLVRIDDRLIHGQVTVGWVQSLRADRIVVCDDVLAASEWEQDICLESVPDGLQAEFIPEREFVEKFKNGAFSDGRIIVLVESPDILMRLVKNGVQFKEINIGGLHFKDESREMLPYVYLNSGDLEALEYLTSQKIEIACQDTPAARRTSLSTLREKLKK